MEEKPWQLADSIKERSRQELWQFSSCSSQPWQLSSCSSWLLSFQTQSARLTLLEALAGLLRQTDVDVIANDESWQPLGARVSKRATRGFY